MKREYPLIGGGACRVSCKTTWESLPADIHPISGGAPAAICDRLPTTFVVMRT